MLDLKLLWCSRPPVILPLAFLAAFGCGLSELATIYLLRAINCEAYKAKQLDPPPDDVCRLPDVQRAYSKDLSVILAISTILSISLAGSYGKLSDTKGRKRALSVAVLLTAAGDAWLGLTALNTPFHTVYSVQAAAVFKGLGGGFAILNAVHSAFVADTSPMTLRSFYMGLLWIMYWLGAAVSPLVSAYFMELDLYARNFALAVMTWAIYLLYACFALPETLQVATAEESVDFAARKVFPSWPEVTVVFRDMWKPMPLIFGHPVLRWLGFVSSATLLGSGAFILMVPYFDGKFGLRPQQAAMITTLVYASKASTVLCLLPLFIALYRRQQRANNLGSFGRPTFVDDDPGEDVSLLPQSDETLGLDATTPANTESKESAAAQELVICRTSFLLEALGVILTWRSTSATHVALAAMVSALGAAAGPSLSSLITLAAAPEEMGRVLAGKSALESAALAVRTPFFYALYDATLDSNPGAIWICAAAVLVTCAGVMTSLRPRHFRMVS